LGMNWLHQSIPPIMHRDLKPSNLLVDEHGTIKVCDFGLSMIKIGETHKDKNSVPGTPLWMAPEVLMGKPLNEKCDVYSYALVLWEIATQQRLFPKMTAAIFKKAICVDNVRPELPEKMLDSLKLLLQEMWQKDAALRPDFSAIIERLDRIIVEAALHDSAAQAVWLNKFCGRHQVTWSDFEKEYATALKAASGNDDRYLIVLKSLLAFRPVGDQIDPPYMVNIENFGLILDTFGPLDVLLEKTYDIVSKSWFHGDISTTDSELAFKDKGPGFFLVRMSTTNAGTFTISKVSKNGKINHQRIEKDEQGFYCVKRVDASGTTRIISRKTLPQLIDDGAVDLNLLYPLPGSKYEHLFSAHRDSEGYFLVDTD